MLGDLKGIFAMIETFAGDLFAADIESAKADAAAAQARVRKLEKQRKAIDSLMARYRASVAKTDKAQKEWQHKYKKNLRKFSKLPAYPVGGVTEAFVGEPPRQKRAG